MKKKILVTGAGGFIGHHLVRELTRRGHNIIAVDPAFYDSDMNHARTKFIKHKNVTLVRLKIEEVDDKSKYLDGINAIIHLAAIAGVQQSIDSPARSFFQNTMSMTTALLMAGTRKVPLIYASSSSVNGAGDAKLGRFEPLSPYGASKIACEALAHSFSECYGIKTIGIRPFTVYGPRGRNDMVIYKIANALRLGHPAVMIYSNGTTERCFTYVDDVVERFIKVAENPTRAHGGIYDCCGRDSYTIKSVISMTSHIIGQAAIVHGCLTITGLDAAGDIQKSQGNNAPFEKDYGPSKETTLESGLRKFIAWHKEFHKKPKSKVVRQSKLKAR